MCSRWLNHCTLPFHASLRLISWTNLLCVAWTWKVPRMHCGHREKLPVFCNLHYVPPAPPNPSASDPAAAAMDQPQEGSSPYNASCSTLLSMDCQLVDQQSASKPNYNPSLQQAGNPINNRSSTSCLSSNIINDDHEREEQMEDNNMNAHNGMLQGSVIFDMLSAMQFNSHSTINTMHDQPPNINYLNINTPSSLGKSNPNNNNTMSTPDHATLPWHLNLNYNDNIAITSQGHIGGAYRDPTIALQSAPPSGFDPISSFLKLPVLADQSKLEGVDQRLMSAYSTYYSNIKEDHYGSSNNNWFNSLQLESIRPDCSNTNNDDIEDEGHVVQYLDHNNMEGTSEEARLLMKLNGTHEEASMSSEDHRVLNESYKPISSMHMLSSYHNGEQLLYTLNEGVDIEGGQGSAMLDNMHMMMMGYNNDPRPNAEYGGSKGGASSIVLGGNVKTSRKRGVRGSGKNSEERESQRMTHIAVERNRRRQMNEHLRVLRALMPPSYIQRGDQASIIGGAIEFVKELEQLLQCLESQKRRRMMGNPSVNHVSNMQQPPPSNPTSAVLPQGFVMQPGYGAPSSHDDHAEAPISTCVLDEGALQNMQLNSLGLKEEVAQAKSAVADIEVKVVERSEALIKILSQRRPRQLLHTIVALQDHLHFNILHTNVTTIDNTVLYSFTVKIQNDRDCSSADQIASLVHEIFLEIINHNPMKDL